MLGARSGHGARRCSIGRYIRLTRQPVSSPTVQRSTPLAGLNSAHHLEGEDLVATTSGPAAAAGLLLGRRPGNVEPALLPSSNGKIAVRDDDALLCVQRISDPVNPVTARRPPSPSGDPADGAARGSRAGTQNAAERSGPLPHRRPTPRRSRSSARASQQNCPRSEQPKICGLR
jgi:hypothetical protein